MSTAERLNVRVNVYGTVLLVVYVPRGMHAIVHRVGFPFRFLSKSQVFGKVERALLMSLKALEKRNAVHPLSES